MPSGSVAPVRHYALLLFADFGHIAPTLGVARELIARGHRVTYVIDDFVCSTLCECFSCAPPATLYPSVQSVQRYLCDWSRDSFDCWRRAQIRPIHPQIGVTRCLPLYSSLS